MFAVVPESLSIHGTIRRGVIENTIVESIDLLPTLANLAELTLPKQVSTILPHVRRKSVTKRNMYCSQFIILCDSTFRHLQEKAWSPSYLITLRLYIKTTMSQTTLWAHATNRVYSPFFIACKYMMSELLQDVHFVFTNCKVCLIAMAKASFLYN